MTAALTPDLALAYIRELSADYLAGVVLDAHGEALAGAQELAPLAREIAGTEGATSRGRVFAARDATHTIVVATTPRALPGPTRRDVRTALRALGGESAQETPFTPIQDAVVNALIGARPRRFSAPQRHFAVRMKVSKLRKLRVFSLPCANPVRSRC